MDKIDNFITKLSESREKYFSEFVGAAKINGVPLSDRDVEMLKSGFYAGFKLGYVAAEEDRKS